MLLRASAQGLKFCCNEPDSRCTIEEWNPSEEGYFFLNHMPNGTHVIKIVNLQNVLLEAKLCSTVVQFVNSLSVENSPKLGIVIIPATCTIETLIMFKTGVRIIHFEKNSAIISVTIRNSPITNIPATLLTLPAIQHILLEYTKIASIDLSWFYPLKGLATLKLVKSNLQVVHGEGSTNVTTGLNVINLSYNSLRALNLNGFAPFAELTQLVLAHNKLESLTGALNIPALTGLMLNHNRLKQLDACQWNDTQRLQGITLAHNYLRQVPACLERFASLAHVDLNHNRIGYVRWEDLQQLPKLASIDLSFNRITAIPADQAQYPPLLKQLDLCGNPIGVVTIPDGLNDSIHVTVV
uniref:Leucine rich immune protein (Coil-less) n=2 Tax=Anopheles merus TaxID=30066 RepID=A0A182UXW3_ANOME